ncbi:unnamed protein product [Rotaria sp. Silwood1]|nr:unnamed protein product [Rotaria sp. Silwood1]CAF1681638.1 unnamed protein product [Rotaria sp. Silwood1]
MSDEEVEMVLSRKSRFSRYRTQVRKKINLDINEAMQIDDSNITSMNDISDSEEPNTVFIDKIPIVTHDFSDDGTDSIDTNDDAEEIYEAQCNVFDNDFETQQPPNATELSVMLLFVWRKHSMSKAVVNDICRILNAFNVPNMPKDFRGVMSHIKKNNPTLLHGNQSFICPSCFNRSLNASKCNVKGCQSASSYVRTPTSVSTFPILPQIIAILERENLASLTYESDQCRDVMNSQRHYEIVMKEKQTHPGRNIVTLTLNSDGTLIKRLSRSLWITCACINELPRRKRFEINNILICSISTGAEKPKRKEYSTILIDIVNELKFLEHVGFDIVLPSDKKGTAQNYTHFHAFTISAVCDKPAQSLLMNIKDSTGFFSCGWCCITGKTSSSGARCFISNEKIPIKIRNNATYDAFMQLLARNYVPKHPMKDKACGQLGYCALRELTYFEIGESFCFDSLHGLYAGTFAANCVSIVHSQVHVHQTLRKFGPLHNYSTFNFESTVGSIVKSIYGPSVIIPELINNFELVSHATDILKNPSFHPKIALLIHQMLFSKRRAVPTCISPNIEIHLAHPTTVKFLHVATYLETTYGKKQFTHYSLCFVKGVTFKVHCPTNKQVDDSALVYVDESDNIHLGVIAGIVKLKDTGNILFIVDEAKIIGYDSFLLNGTEYINDFFIFATLKTPRTTVSIHYDSIREKVAYRSDENLNSVWEFHLFPNRQEST